MEGLFILTRSVSLPRKLIGKLLLETAAERKVDDKISLSESSVVIFPIIHIEPVSRGSFTSRQCLCRGPRCRSAVIKQHAVCLYTMQVTLLPTNRAQCVVDLWWYPLCIVQWQTPMLVRQCNLQIWWFNYLGTSSVKPSAASLSSWSEPPAPKIN